MFFEAVGGLTKEEGTAPPVGEEAEGSVVDDTSSGAESADCREMLEQLGDESTGQGDIDIARRDE